MRNTIAGSKATTTAAKGHNRSFERAVSAALSFLNRIIERTPSAEQAFDSNPILERAHIAASLRWAMSAFHPIRLSGELLPPIQQAPADNPLKNARASFPARTIEFD